MVLKVAIIGAGIAGCTLARLLLNNTDIQVIIFEGETSINVRVQGGTLDLREGSGLDAIEAAGLYSEFLKYARYDGESLKIMDKNLFSWLSVGGRSNEGKKMRGGRPEIDRLQLRKLLIDSLPNGMIVWGKRLQRIDTNRTLHFQDGIESGFDLVVGADGAWSKVRPLVSNAEPKFLGVGGAQFTISDVAERFPDLNKLVNKGSVFACSDHKYLAAQQMSDGGLSCAAFQVAEESIATDQDKETYLLDTLESLSDWAPELRKIVEVADVDSVWPRNLYMLPVGHKWAPRQGVTLIGDAAHLTTPFAGIGANLAMQDALKLSKAIISASQDVGGDALLHRITSFEEEMFKRALKGQIMSVKNMEDMVTIENDAPRKSIARWVSRALVDMSPVGGRIIQPIVYLYFFILGMFV